MLTQRLIQFLFPVLVEILLFAAFIAVAIMQGVNKITRRWRQPPPV